MQKERNRTQRRAAFENNALTAKRQKKKTGKKFQTHCLCSFLFASLYRFIYIRMKQFLGRRLNYLFYALMLNHCKINMLQKLLKTRLVIKNYGFKST